MKISKLIGLPDREVSVESLELYCDSLTFGLKVDYEGSRLDVKPRFS
jgi:hypothetical protein